MRLIGLLAVVPLFMVIPLAGETQQAEKVYRIGYLSGNPQVDTQKAIEAFIDALHDFGFVEGRNLAIENRYADGNFDRLPRLVEELIQHKVDVILTFGTPATPAARNATKTVPVVFGAVADPIVAGLVVSLPRPGGNVTGTTTINPDLSEKRLALLAEALPRARRIAVLANPNFPPTPKMIGATRRAAATLVIQARAFEARTQRELTPTFKAIATWKADGLDVLPDAMFIAQHRRIVELAGDLKIPTVFHLTAFAEVGGLMSYRPSYTESFRRSAALVNKIFRGARPADLPVEQPTKFELVINLKTAKALGLTIPQTLLLRADQVIE